MKNNRTLWIVIVVVLAALGACCAATAGLVLLGGWQWGNAWIDGGRT